LVHDNSAPSLSQRLHDELTQVISETPPGDQLPSEPKLARQMGVSRATLREAMRIFETQGLIRRRQGVGTFVVHPPNVIESGLEVLESIESLAKRIGLQVAMGELKMEHRPATSKESQVLGSDSREHVLSLSRVILAEGRPVAFFIDTLPEDVLTKEEVEAGFSGSVLELLLQRGEPALVNSRCEISAVDAGADIAKALNIQRGDALLCFHSKLYTHKGRVVDFSISYFLPGYFRFHVVRELLNHQSYLNSGGL
jgi:GntR family transcriptional regulator